MVVLTDEAAKVATEAVGLAGELINAQLTADLRISQKGNQGDIVTNLDHAAERKIIRRIQQSFPHHRIISEECGIVAGDAQWTWLVDPLDGTNNVALRIPLFGACVTLCDEGSPTVAAIYSGHRGVTYTAARGRGVRSDLDGDTRLRGGFVARHTTVSWIQGYAVDKADDAHRAALWGLTGRFKRVLQTWAPSVDWALLAESRIGAVIAYQNEPEDLLGGALLAAEAGAVITDFAGNTVSDVSTAPRLVVAAPELVDDIIEALTAA